MLDRRPLAYAGALLILAVGLIHALEAPDALEEQTYLGVLFILNAVGSLAIACALVARPSWRPAWTGGAVIAAGAFVAFILSRTTGLPSFKEADWEPLGLVALAVEAAFVVVAARALTVRSPGRGAGRRGMGAAATRGA